MAEESGAVVSGAVEEDEPMEETTGPVKKPVSAFLHYCAEQRPAVKLTMPNAGAGEITKAISESWRGLSDEEKQKFVDLATADKDRYERERKTDKADKKALEPHETVIPIARVKKIVKLDPEVKSVSKEATAVIAKMTELFVGRLAKETHVASTGKRIVKASDVAHCIHNRPAFAWLRADYPMAEYTAKAVPKPKLVAPENNATISQFFQPAPKKQAVEDTNLGDEELDEDEASTRRPAVNVTHQLLQPGPPPDAPRAPAEDDEESQDDLEDKHPPLVS